MTINFALKTARRVLGLLAIGVGAHFAVAADGGYTSLHSFQKKHVYPDPLNPANYPSFSTIGFVPTFNYFSGDATQRAVIACEIGLENNNRCLNSRAANGTVDLSFARLDDFNSRYNQIKIWLPKGTKTLETVYYLGQQSPATIVARLGTPPVTTVPSNAETTAGNSINPADHLGRLAAGQTISISHDGGGLMKIGASSVSSTPLDKGQWLYLAFTGYIFKLQANASAEATAFKQEFESIVTTGAFDAAGDPSAAGTQPNPQPNPQPDPGCTAATQTLALGGKVSGAALTTANCSVTNTAGKFYYADYAISLTAGQQINLGLLATSFDGTLELFNPSGASIQSAAAVSGGNARIPTTGYFSVPTTGQYKVRISTGTQIQLGTYNLSSELYVAPTANVCTQLPSALTLGTASNGELKSTSCSVAKGSGNAYYADFILNGTVGQQVYFSLKSTSFDAYLELRDASGTVLRSNGGVGSDTARIPQGQDYFTLTAAGTYAVRVTSVDPGGFGAFVLSSGTVAQAVPGKLINISTRGMVGTGDAQMIVSFIVSDGAKKVLITGKGPSMTKQGVKGVLEDPNIDLVDAITGKVVASNNDWQSASNSADIPGAVAANGNKPAPTEAKESALLLTLPVGVYSAIMNGAGANPTGIGLVSVDELK